MYSLVEALHLLHQHSVHALFIPHRVALQRRFNVKVARELREQMLKTTSYSQNRQ